MPRRVDEALVTAVGARIRSHRDVLGITQEELAERATLHAETLSRIERGRMQPTLTLLVALANGLGESVGCLLGETAHDLDEDELALLEGYRRLDGETQTLLRELLHRLG